MPGPPTPPPSPPPPPLPRVQARFTVEVNLRPVQKDIKVPIIVKVFRNFETEPFLAAQQIYSDGWELPVQARWPESGTIMIDPLDIFTAQANAPHFEQGSATMTWLPGNEEMAGLMQCQITLYKRPMP